ncbi:MAG: sugar phosphate isomerase/epimerase [Firmicutes bacterium]|nr:sugar phosphate isomerase/epimerase [Bacillota bacterium]
MLNLKDKLYVATFQNNAIEVAKTYGLGIEYNHTCISEALDAEHRSNLLSAMQKDFDEAGFISAIMHGPFTEIIPAGIDHRAREAGRSRLEEAFDVCHALGVKNMVVHNGWVPFMYFKEWQAEKGAQFWEEFMADKPSDFTIYVENVLEDEPYMMASMMEHVNDSRIKICLDIGHANATTPKDIPVEKWVEVLGPYIGHFHLHNNDGTGDSHGDFEQGSMDMNSIFDAIEKHCHTDVTFTIEARECENCAKWLKDKGYI